MNSFTGSLRVFILAALALAFVSREANATQALIDQGDTTYDPNTGLVWLDLRFTQGQSYESIRGGWGGFTTSLGYRFATADEIKQLFLHAGAKSLGSPSNPPVSVNVEAAKLILSLLGTTLPMADTNRSWMFYDPASDTPPSSSYVPTAVFGEGIIGGGYPGREGFFLVPGLYPLTNSSSPEWASALVKRAPETVPDVVFYANDFDAGAASLDGLEKILEPIRGEASVTVEAGQLKVAIADIGYAGVSCDLRIGNPLFKQKLPTNHGMLTWAFNISNEDGLFNNNFDFVLASSHADPFDIAAHGYSLRGGGMVGNRMVLWRFSHGLPGGGEVIDIPNGLGPLPQKGSFRVTFDPETKLWCVYGEIGASYTNPRDVKTLLGSGTDNTHIKEPLPYMALLGQTTGADYFDNVSVSMNTRPNRPPVVQADEVFLTGESPLMIYPLSNDEDPEGESLRIASVTASRSGTVEIIPGSSERRDALRYTPGPGVKEMGETLTYSVVDPEGATVSGLISIVPTPSSVWTGIDLFLLPGEAVAFSVLEGLPEAGQWRIAGVGAPERGSLDNGPEDALVSLGKVRYTPAAGTVGKDSFTVSLIDANGVVVTREVSVHRPPSGRFEGLYVNNTSRREAEGRLRVNLSRSRQFSAVVQLRGRTKRIRGRMDATGNFQTSDGATLKIQRKDGQLSVRGYIPAQPSEQDASEGSTEPAGWYANAERVIYGEAGDREGRYTLVLPADSAPGADSDLAVPIRGHGWGVLRVFASGAVTMAGATGDGKHWTSAGVLRNDRTLLLYGAITHGKRRLPGSLAGTIFFRQDDPESDGDGILHWLPPFIPGKQGSVSKNAQRQPILLSHYVEPAPGTLPIAAAAGINNAEFLFSTAPVVQIVRGRGVLIRLGGTIHIAPVTLSSTGFNAPADAPGSTEILAKIRPQSGVFRGFYQDLESEKWRFFKGVIFQKTQSGQGALMDYDLPGAVTLRLPAR